MNLQLLLTYISVLKTAITVKLAKTNSAKNAREAQVIKLEHIIVLRTQTNELATFRAPWSVSVQDLCADIEQFEYLTRNIVVDVGCEFNARAETRELVRKIKERIL